ncbi:hypothetical protein [Aliterella atlantica]|uniref:Uncharacterized protein n=1 Tax=Aliterella atlantica CENA595 TaxID=1618023 RepID=A0A0D8ZMI8_9CYAN|nr:hypothetical protein [Aliterella atlantica]KJH69659.1 hypothetical protein UH38_22800 [Aliterella atlantica CENA595]
MKKLCIRQQKPSNSISQIIKLLTIGILSNSLTLISSQLPSVAAGGCNTYGCWRTSTGGCNSYGCWENSGGCNSYGCWHSLEGNCNSYGCTNNRDCSSYGCPLPEETANPPRLSWTIATSNISVEECQEKAYQAMQTLKFTSLKARNTSNIKYVAGERKNNTARIACHQNNTVFILVAGKDANDVGDLFKQLKYAVLKN